MRKLFVLLFISAILVCILAAFVDSAFASVPFGALTPVDPEASRVTPSPAVQSPAQCVIIGNSSCFATGNPVPYSFAQGATVNIKGRRWAAKAAVELYLLPTSGTTSATGQVQPGSNATRTGCPAPSALAAGSVTHSALEMTGTDGSFSAQLTLPAPLKVDTLYNLCISVTSSDHATSRLLFQINVTANLQQQTGSVPITSSISTTGGSAPSSFTLSLIALALALVALLLFFISPRQPAIPHPNEKRNAS